MDFPAARYRRAGATDEELATLRADFETRVPAGQEALLAQLAGISDGDIAEQLEAARAQATEPEEEPEAPVAPRTMPPAPGASTPSTEE